MKNFGLLTGSVSRCGTQKPNQQKCLTKKRMKNSIINKTNSESVPLLVEWSMSQSCFHIVSLGEALEINQDAFQKGQPIDYIPLAKFPSFDAASDWIDAQEAAGHRPKPLPEEIKKLHREWSEAVWAFYDKGA